MQHKSFYMTVNTGQFYNVWRNDLILKMDCKIAWTKHVSND